MSFLYILSNYVNDNTNICFFKIYYDILEIEGDDMSDYERLKQQGYSEEQIKLALDQLSNIKIEKAPLGPNREDKSATVKDSEGIEKKTSHIMMGYNKKRIVLSDGQYVNEEEFEKALNENLNSNEKDAIYVCKKTGKLVESAQIAQEILKSTIKKSSTLKLSADSSIKNQNTARVSIMDSKEKEYPKGVFMLGNGNLQLPNGQYVNGEEIAVALNDYVKLTPPAQKEIVPSNHEEIYKVIKRIVSKFSYIPLLVSTLIMILSGLGFKDKKITEMVLQEQANLKHTTTKMQQMSEEEIKNVVYDNLVKLKTGDSVEIPSGLKYYSSSDHEKTKNSKSGTFGSVTRPEGTYNVDFISILYNGNIVHTEYNLDVGIEETLENVAQKMGVSKNDLKMELHIGGPVAGWVNADELINKSASNSHTKVNVNLKEAEKQKGVSDNFNGSTITIDNGVVLKVVDENGNLLPGGSIVTGSDGQKYRLDNLEIETEKVNTLVEVGTKKKLNWSIHNITKEELLLAASVGIIGTYLTSTKKKEMTNMTESQIENLVSEAKQKFDNQSEFQKAVINITKKNPVPSISPEEQLKQSLIDQEITVEDIDDMKRSGGLKF